MWQRFTENARRCVFNAQDHAQRLATTHVAPEELFLGLLDLPECTAARLLKDQDVKLDEVGREVESGLTVVFAGGELMMLTASARQVLSLAFSESKDFGHYHIGSEHLLLGIMRADESVVGKLLAARGVNPDSTRALITADKV